MPENQYLGDGLYVSFDGYQIRLWTERATGTHEVFLEPGTLQNFLRYVEVTRVAERSK